jgi:hypothetical protein
MFDGYVEFNRVRQGAPYRLCLLAVAPLAVDDRLCRRLTARH